MIKTTYICDKCGDETKLLWIMTIQPASTPGGGGGLDTIDVKRTSWGEYKYGTRTVEVCDHCLCSFGLQEQVK